MKITPFDLNETKQEEEIKASSPLNTSNEINETDEINEVIDEILEESNIINKNGEASPNSKLSSFLTQAGGSLEKVAQNIVDVMNRGDTDSGRLKAAEFISKMHGVQVQLEEQNNNNKTAQAITVNINGADSKTMINFFMPKS